MGPDKYPRMDSSMIQILQKTGYLIFKILRCTLAPRITIKFLIRAALQRSTGPKTYLTAPLEGEIAVEVDAAAAERRELAIVTRAIFPPITRL